MLETFDYYPFGLLMPKRSSTTGNTLEKFTGKERDEEGGLNLDYFGARYYDPALGRWHSYDPILHTGVIEDLINKGYLNVSPYNYVFNNPMNLFDPDGQMACEDEVDDCRKIAQKIVVNQTTTIERRKHTKTIEVTINFVPTQDGVSSDKEVTNEFADAIETTVAEAVLGSDITSITISSTTNGEHSETSNHPKGRAVDVSAINGVSVLEHGDSKQVRSLQNAFERRPKSNENFGPSRMTKRGGSYIHNGLTATEKLRRTIVSKNHQNHLHLSIDP